MSHLVYITLFGETDGVTLSRLDCMVYEHVVLDDQCDSCEPHLPDAFLQMAIKKGFFLRD